MNPTVSFVVPCYKLAGLLPQCIKSILGQTYQDFEILIMDDCSPDNTPEAARSFVDPRIIHIRHEQNLGHLRNYNEGIAHCRGQFIWLISADDVLKSPRILERYMEVFERNPTVGFVFCPGVALRDNGEGEVLEWSVCGSGNRIWGSEEFLRRIMAGNCVVAASGMVRKECYDKVGSFPSDLPYAADWYMWCAFALYFDVAYLSEPMAFYRLHDVSMTNTMARRRRLVDNNEVPWRILHQAERLGYRSVVKICTESLASHYAYCVSAETFGLSDYSMTTQEMEESIQQHENIENAHGIIRARVYSVLADHYYSRDDVDAARRNYRLALAHKWWLPKVWIKSALLRSGRIGAVLRDSIIGTPRGNHA